MEKRRAGSTDCIKHSLDLFFDLAAIFRRLLIILSQKEEREQRKRKNNWIATKTYSEWYSLSNI